MARERAGVLRLLSDVADMDLDWAYAELSAKSYWAKGRSREDFDASVANSLVFGVARGSGPSGRQIAFARVATDRVGIAYLLDVWVGAGDRGSGVGRFLINGILSDPRLSRVRKWLLFTEDAQEFYRGLGFRPTASPEGYMELKPEEPQGSVAPFSA